MTAKPTSCNIDLLPIISTNIFTPCVTRLLPVPPSPPMYMSFWFPQSSALSFENANATAIISRFCFSLSLRNLPLFPATDLTNGFLVALAVTFSSYQLKTAHGISARLSHIYLVLIELATSDASYDVIDFTLEDDESDG